jgi:hypothetical protein
MKQLTLPKKIKVGDNWYSVHIAEAMRERLYMGVVPRHTAQAVGFARDVLA